MKLLACLFIIVFSFPAESKSTALRKQGEFMWYPVIALHFYMNLQMLLPLIGNFCFQFLKKFYCKLQFRVPTWTKLSKLNFFSLFLKYILIPYRYLFRFCIITAKLTIDNIEVITILSKLIKWFFISTGAPFCHQILFIMPRRVCQPLVAKLTKMIEKEVTQILEWFCLLGIFIT
jgi:hypothetical protein